MSDEPVQRRGLGARLGRLVLLGLGPLVLLVGGTYYYVISGRYVTTENAYLKADKIAVSTDVSGPVAMVAVGENDQVVQGQTLFRIDERRYRIVLARKEAELRTARQNVEVLRALHRQKVAELEATRQEVRFHESEFKRSEGLKKGGHVSQANYDKTRRDLLMARHRVEAVRQDIAGVLASLGGDPEAPNDRHPKVLEALTERERAQLDVLRTTVVAPLGAIVSNIDLQIGEYVTAGTPVFSLVAAERVWVQANLKETDLTHVRVGQQARVMVDAYPDHSWPARVASISPATGAEFALLPPQNASGNWVKVVQRVPLRLELERRPSDPPLRAGMSVEVEIDTQVARSLPGLIDSALAWVTGAR
jgi:membrane fusion protein (multidrug efflux system)